MHKSQLHGFTAALPSRNRTLPDAAFAFCLVALLQDFLRTFSHNINNQNIAAHLRIVLIYYGDTEHNWRYITAQIIYLFLLSLSLHSSSICDGFRWWVSVPWSSYYFGRPTNYFCHSLCSILVIILGSAILDIIKVLNMLISCELYIYL